MADEHDDDTDVLIKRLIEENRGLRYDIAYLKILIERMKEKQDEKPSAPREH